MPKARSILLLRETREKDGTFNLKADNTHDALMARLQPFYQDSSLPAYPLGSDFIPVEQRITRSEIDDE